MEERMHAWGLYKYENNSNGRSVYKQENQNRFLYWGGNNNTKWIV